MDDTVACKNLRCRERFDVFGIQSMAFLVIARFDWNLPTLFLFFLLLLDRFTRNSTRVSER
jgi:hypothetical protein